MKQHKRLFNLSGVKDDIETKSIDAMNPSTREEFMALSELIVGKLSNYEVRLIPTRCKKYDDLFVLLS